MKKLSFFLVLTSFNALSVEVSGTGIDSSNRSCHIINVGGDGTEVKTGEDGSGTKTVVICEDKTS
jgi:hypothetical protein